MNSSNLKQWLGRALVQTGSARKENPPSDRVLGGLGERGRVSLVLHDRDTQPSLAILTNILREEATEDFKIIDVKGSLATAFRQNGLGPRRGQLIEALPQGRAERLNSTIAWVELIDRMEAGPDTLFIAGLDGLGKLDALGSNAEFLAVVNDYAAKGHAVIASARIEEWGIFAAIEAGRKIADRVFGVERIFPAPAQTTRFRFSNLTDRYQLDQAVYTYSGKKMAEKLAALLK